MSPDYTVEEDPERETPWVPCLASSNDKLSYVEFVWPKRVSGSKAAHIYAENNAVVDVERMA